MQTPSGCGKSSLVQAGLLPLLRARRPRQPEVGWQVPTPLQVAGDPFAALHGALAAAGGPPPPSAAELRNNLAAVRDWGAAWLGSHPCERLLVVVDQAEELVTRLPPGGTEKPGDLPAASAGFLSCLRTLLEAGAGRLRILLVVRADSSDDLKKGPLASFQNAGSFAVPPLSREELRQIIEGPFSRKALYFDDPRRRPAGRRDLRDARGAFSPSCVPQPAWHLAYLRNGRGDRLLTALDLEEVAGKPAARADNPVAESLLRVLRDAASRTVGSCPTSLTRRRSGRISCV